MSSAPPVKSDTSSLTEIQTDKQDEHADVKPKITKEQVPDIIWRLYGMKVTSLKELVSYYDLNYYFRVEDEVDNPYITDVNKDGYVFKILNTTQSSQTGIVDGQHAYLRWLGDRDIPVHTPVHNRDGDQWSLETFTHKHGEKQVRCGPYIVRVLTYIPGLTFQPTPFVSGSFYNVGQFLGKLHKATKGFKHTFYDSYTFEWSLTELPTLTRKYVHLLNNSEDTALIQQVMDGYEKTVVPQLAKFSKGVIHGDATGSNFIMHEVPGQEGVSKESRVHDVSTLIDYADSSLCYYVFDIAINIAHLSESCTDQQQLEVGGHILAGYLRHADLQEQEFVALKQLICCRLVQIPLNCAIAIQKQPDNVYLLNGIEESWSLLRKLWQMDADSLYTKWRSIIKSYTAL